MNSITNGFKIYIEDSGKAYHSIEDFGFAIANTNYIGDPVLEETIIDIPFSNPLDLSEVATGYPVFKNRPINLELGCKRPRWEWDALISKFRNLYDGKICRIVFDNDPLWYWQGRVRIQNVNRVRTLGTFTLYMDALATKYSVEEVVIPINGETPIDIIDSDYPTVPIIYYRGSAASAYAYIKKNGGEVYRQNLVVGDNIIPGFNTQAQKLGWNCGIYVPITPSGVQPYVIIHARRRSL